jgi:uncharacterized membrane protein
MSQETRLDRVIEAVLSAGLLLSATLLAGGLVLGSQGALRWGALLLMLTPVARVVVVTVALALKRDWVFAVVSLWILSVLVWSAWSAVRA